MLIKKFLINWLGLVSLIVLSSGYAQGPGYSISIYLNTEQSISGQPLKITNVTAFPPFTTKQASPVGLEISVPDNPSGNLPAADIIVAPEINSPNYCLVHVTAGPLYLRPDVQFQADSTQCSTGVFFANAVLNPNGNCQWPPNACYQINFYSVTLKK